MGFLSMLCFPQHALGLMAAQRCECEWEWVSISLFALCQIRILPLRTFKHIHITLVHTHCVLYWPISASSTSALCRCPVPWYTRPMPTTAATCTLCGTSSSVEVGGSKAGTWMLSRRVTDMSMVPSLAAETPNKSPMLVISWPWGKKWETFSSKLQQC